MRSFIGYADMERGAVGIRVDGHGANVHFPEGADDADGDFPSIGD